MTKFFVSVVFSGAVALLGCGNATAQATRLLGGAASVKGIAVGMSISSPAIAERFDCAEPRQVSSDLKSQLPALGRALSAGRCKLKASRYESVAMVPVQDWTLATDSAGNITQIEVTVRASEFEALVEALRSRYGEESRRAKRLGYAPEVLDWVFQRGTLRLIGNHNMEGLATLLVTDGPLSPYGVSIEQRVKDL